jgi:hypothetical protein
MMLCLGKQQFTLSSWWFWERHTGSDQTFGLSYKKREIANGGGLSPNGGCGVRDRRKAVVDTVHYKRLKFCLMFVSKRGISLTHTHMARARTPVLLLQWSATRVFFSEALSHLSPNNCETYGSAAALFFAGRKSEWLPHDHVHHISGIPEQRSSGPLQWPSGLVACPDETG